MIKFVDNPSVQIALLLAALVLLILCLGTGCSPSNPYVGPTVSTVGVTGSYSDHDGNTYGGGVQVGLNPPPTSRPVDRSK